MTTDRRPVSQKADHAGSPCALIVRPPYVIAPDIGVVAVDLTFGANGQIPAGAPMMCLGRHPAAECLLDVEGSGPSHPAAIAVDPSSPFHLLMIERIKELFDPSFELQIVDRPVL